MNTLWGGSRWKPGSYIVRGFRGRGVHIWKSMLITMTKNTAVTLRGDQFFLPQEKPVVAHVHSDVFQPPSGATLGC